jgi:DNA-binding HxlR family transcriptional regulator
VNKEQRVLRLSRELTGQWTLPILLALEERGGRFTPLQNKLNIAPSRLSANLKKMVEDGLLIHLSPAERRHPLLPEYVLTDKGRLYREAARAVHLSEQRIGHGRLSDKVWGLPILLTIGYDHTRFQEIRQTLEGITPRILSTRLQEYLEDGMIFRQIKDEPRPTFLYLLEKQVQRPIRQLSLDLASLV